MEHIYNNVYIDNESLGRMRAILAAGHLRPKGIGPQTDEQHVEHCFHQMVRFANLAAIGNEFRALQFGLNMGRAQEILDSNGGVGCWWRLYEPLLEQKKYAEVMDATMHYIELLELRKPTTEFIHKI